MFARVLLGTTSTVRALTSFVEALLLIYYKGVLRHSYIYKHIEDHRMLVLQTAPTCIMINHVCFGLQNVMDTHMSMVNYCFHYLKFAL